MESGLAFLHPRNLFFRENVARDYAPIPFSIWRPCIPWIEKQIPPLGPAPWRYRIVRLLWVLISTPIWIVFVLGMELTPQDWAQRLGPSILPRRPSWTLWQRVTYPILARTVWAITFGLHAPESVANERSVPFLAKTWYGRGTSMDPFNAAFEDSEEERKWVKDEAVDPAGMIKSQDYLAAFWIRARGIVEKPREDGIEVVMYLVGGGYITGHPLEASRVFDIARFSCIPVMGVNYRKSITRETAFPAALQDTIAGYAYLTRKGYKRIAIGGDSAGAGLALALMQYLAKMSEKDDRPAKIILPAAALFYSPWADLTVSHDYEDGVYFDIIHPTMLRQAAAVYTSDLDRYSQASDANEAGSIALLKNKHPYFSPALATSVDSLRKIRIVAAKLGQQVPQFLIFVGGAELFSAECASLSRNLREAGLEVEEYREDDEVHGFLLVPTFMSPKILPALQRMGRFLKSA